MATPTYLGQNAQTSTSSPSLSGISVSAGDILAVAIITFLVAPAPLVTACTHDGETLSEIAVVGPTGVAPNTWVHIAFRARVVASPATATVNATLAGTATRTLIAAWVVSGGDTGTPTGDTDSLVASATSNALTLTTESGAVVLSGIVVPDGWTDFAIAPQSGTTADYQNDAAGSGDTVEIAVGSRVASGSSTGIGWDFSYTKDSLHVAIVIKTAAAGGGNLFPPFPKQPSTLLRM